jgi:hypothetical protein
VRRPSRPLFECLQAAFGGGAIYAGYFIDDTGALWHYDRLGREWSPELSDPSSDPKDQSFVGARLLEHYTQVRFERQLPRDIVHSMAAKLPEARKGKVSRMNVGADGGGKGCDGYVWDLQRDTYVEVTLGSRGDFRVTNEAPQAQELLEWLASIEPLRPFVPEERVGPLKSEPF